MDIVSCDRKRGREKKRKGREKEEGEREKEEGERERGREIQIWI